METSAGTRLEAGRGNALYTPNREPMVQAPMMKLPLGAVTAKGWLKHQLDLMTEGMTGRLPELSKFLKQDNGWLGGANPGWEEQPYWLRGFYDLAALTGNKRLLAEANRWIEAVVASQNADGYFGAEHEKKLVGQNGQKMVDLWPHMVMLDALISHHDFTGDSRIIPLMRRFFEFCRNLPEDQFVPPIDIDAYGDWKPMIQWSRAGDMIPHLHWLYNRTGEPWLLDLGTRFHHHVMGPVNERLDNHVINFTQRFGYPGTYYAQSGQSWHLEATEYWYTQHMAVWGQQPRGIFAADEQVRSGCVDPRQAFETCGFPEFNKHFYALGRLTGNPVYADRIEDLMFNHFPASLTPDLKALHYLTASNQPQLDASENHEYTNKGKQICYSPHQCYRCCQHNVAMTWPWFVENLWQATTDGGLAAWIYAPCRVSARVAGGTEVTVDEATDYPFKGNVSLTVRTRKPAAFPLHLRVPRWCNGFRVAVNGRTLRVEAVPGGFVRIGRTWKNGDKVEIDMPMEISVRRWPRNGSATVDRGPFSYSVKIGERWQRCGGTDEWPEWEVFPTTPWNYGLILPEGSATKAFPVREKKVPKQPWTPDAAPIEMRAKAKRIPNWKLQNETVAELQNSPIRSGEPEEEILLIPLGCARLRMSCLPAIGAGTDARAWK